MSPVFRRESEYTFKIYSNEEERMHIHVLCGGKEVKFWLEPQVELAKNSGIPGYKLSEIKKIVEKLQTTSMNNSANTSVSVLMINTHGIMLSVLGHDYFLSYNRIPWRKSRANYL